MSSEEELKVEPFGPSLKRTHYCQQLNEELVGQEVVVNGWVHRVRDLGGILFLDIRDRSGIVQLAVDPGEKPELAARCRLLRAEYVVSARGLVQMRPKRMRRTDSGTGAIEIRLSSISLLSRASVPPFQVQDDVKAKEELRLRYRYLDLRRPSMMRNIIIRHEAAQEARRVLSNAGFIEVETPFLIRSTPEGARDYIVPSRIKRGSFYALPQSPQLLKQILMVAGVDRYFQIVKCFRDEDLRSNRQPEFTQIDIELSFADESDVFKISEEITCAVYGKLLDVELPRPFPVIRFEEALRHYGTDKPDVRYGLRLHNVSEFFADSQLAPLRDSVESGRPIVGLSVPNGAGYSRKRLDTLSKTVRELGAFGLVWIKLLDEGTKSSAGERIGQRLAFGLASHLGANKGDIILLAWGEEAKVFTAMGRVRTQVAEIERLAEGKGLAPVWVTEFPMFDRDDETGAITPMHHPFTAIFPEDEALLDSEPLKVRARLYDLVINGQEIASGGVRISDPALQNKVLQVVGIAEEEARRRFGFFLDALRYGTPPHCGIAFGFDRMIMQLCGTESISDVIAFPKTTAAACLMSGAPAPVDQAALDELGLALKGGDEK